MWTTRYPKISGNEVKFAEYLWRLRKLGCILNVMRPSSNNSGRTSNERLITSFIFLLSASETSSDSEIQNFQLFSVENNGQLASGSYNSNGNGFEFGYL